MEAALFGVGGRRRPGGEERGPIRERDLLTHAAEIEGSITGFLDDDEAELAAVLLDIAGRLHERLLGLHPMGASGSGGAPRFGQCFVCDVRLDLR